MDWIRFGQGVRALRRRRGLTQSELGAAASCSQAAISRIERGHGDVVTGRILDVIGQALDARPVHYLTWNGEALDRLLDAGHATIVDAVVRSLQAAGWETRTEHTFAVFGERGSVDVLGWHAATRVLLIVEVKTVIADAQETLGRLDRKVRLAPRFVPEAWRPAVVGALLVVEDTRTNRRRIASLGATFGAAFPDRIVVIRAFLRAPRADAALRGLWFLATSPAPIARHRVRSS